MNFSDITQDYMTPEEAVELLKKAQRVLHPVYISGMTAYGKTELVKQVFYGKKVFYFPFSPSNPDKAQSIFVPVDNEHKTPQIVIFDDLQFLTDKDMQSQLISTIERRDVWPILISRTTIPSWLLSCTALNRIEYIDESKLAITEECFTKYLDSLNIKIDMNQVRRLSDLLQGNPFGLIVLAQKLRKSSDSEQLKEYILFIMAEYIDRMVIPDWNKEMKDFILKLTVLDSFTKELAEYLTGTSYIDAMIDQTMNTCSFLSYQYGSYSIRSNARLILLKKAEITYGFSELRALALKAGEWYEDHGDWNSARIMYTRARHKDRIKNVLIKNSRENPSNGYYQYLCRYYKELTDEEIQENVTLMSGTSMAYSLLLQPDESEFWYGKLAEYEQEPACNDKKEATEWLSYLDISLPQRGSVSTLEIIQKIADRIINKEINLPELSITSNNPSLINGGKDFCEWTKIDTDIITKYGKLITLVTGKHGKSIINLALGESFLEKCIDNEKVISLLSRGQIEAEVSSNMEMEFVAVGLLVRFYMDNGQIETAKDQLSAFETKCLEQHQHKFLPNLKALRCRINLLCGETDEVIKWACTAPNDKKEIMTLLRYEYMTKIRCYIYTGNYLEAYALIEKMKFYAEQYHRTYITMECEILLSIIQFKNNEDEYIDTIISALKMLTQYKFIRIISEEGAIILPILKKVSEKLASPDFDKGEIDMSWFAKLLSETEKMAAHYSSYANKREADATDFSGNALSILKLQMLGLSTPQIAERLGLKLENVRYHIKQNYKKLGVADKTQAIIAAKKLNL